MIELITHNVKRDQRVVITFDNGRKFYVNAKGKFQEWDFAAGAWDDLYRPSGETAK